MQLKTGIKFGNSILAMATASVIADSVFKKHGYECIVTSVNDGIHSTGSLHYKDCAFDLRSRHVETEEKKLEILNDLEVSLGENFDVLYEHRGEANQHFHIEYQPKNS